MAYEGTAAINQTSGGITERERAACSIFPDLFEKESSLEFNETKSLSKGI